MFGVDSCGMGIIHHYFTTSPGVRLQSGGVPNATPSILRPGVRLVLRTLPGIRHRPQPGLTGGTGLLLGPRSALPPSAAPPILRPHVMRVSSTPTIVWLLCRPDGLRAPCIGSVVLGRPRLLLLLLLRAAVLPHGLLLLLLLPGELLCPPPFSSCCPMLRQWRPNLHRLHASTASTSPWGLPPVAVGQGGVVCVPAVVPRLVPAGLPRLLLLPPLLLGLGTGASPLLAGGGESLQAIL